jgi:hypothetical protein
LSCPDVAAHPLRNNIIIILFSKKSNDIFIYFPNNLFVSVHLCPVPVTILYFTSTSDLHLFFLML